MAAATITPRQAEIKALMDQDKTPPEIARALGITDNAVYQHLRRMRDAGSVPKKRAAAKAKTTSGRKTGGKAAAKPAAKAVPRPAEPVSAAAKVTPAPAPERTITPLQAVRARKGAIEADLRESMTSVDQARKVYERAVAAHEKIEGSRGDELARLATAEAALSPRPVAVPDPEPEAPAAAAPVEKVNGSNGSGSKAKGTRRAAAAVQTTPEQPATPPADPTTVAAPVGVTAEPAASAARASSVSGFDPDVADDFPGE